MKIIATAAAVITLCATAAQAQQQAAPLVVGAPSNAGPVLRIGTEVPLKTLRELTTEGKKLRVGDRFDMEVSEAVKLEGHVVIPQGSRAVGEVTAIRNKGMWGKSGSIDVRALYVMVGDRQIRLTGLQNDKGSAGGVGAVAGSLVFLPVGFFVTGTSAHIPLGSQILARLDEDVPVVFAGGGAPTQSPLVAAPLAK
jgi:hypothetical protein